MRMTPARKTTGLGDSRESNEQTYWRRQICAQWVLAAGTWLAFAAAAIYAGFAHQQVTAMNQTNRQTHDALVVTERAYVMVRGQSDRVEDLQPGKIPHTTLAINNTGHTPAYHLTAVDVLEIVAWPLPPTAHFKTFVSKKETTVFSGAPLGLPLNTKEILSQDAFDNLQANVWRPCAWGTITYETFDTWHYTNFCLCYDPKGTPPEYCPYHNDAD
jgi:hypothetical protein